MEKDVRILVVDDDEFLREAIVAILDPFYTVVSADCGRTAFDKIKSDPVDLVLSDVCMANGTGIELLEWVRARDPRIPTLVLVTGYSTVTAEEALKKGAHSVINKPFSSAVLLNTVRDIVETQSLPIKRPA